MSENELSKIDSSFLQEGIQSLEEQHSEELKKLEALRKSNAALCEKLLEINNLCKTQAYLTPFDEDQLQCGEKPTSLEIEAIHLGNHRFRIRANKSYISNEFGEGKSRLNFQRADGAKVKAPRFREITSLNLVSVNSNSTINSKGYIEGVQTLRAEEQEELLKTMKIRILIDGEALHGESQEWLNLRKPKDENLKSELLMDPDIIIRAGKSSKCVVSYEEAKSIQNSSSSSDFDFPKDEL